MSIYTKQKQKKTEETRNNRSMANDRERKKYDSYAVFNRVDKHNVCMCIYDATAGACK